MEQPVNRTEKELGYAEQIEKHFNESCGTFTEKMQSFPRFVSRQQQAIYLYKWELFQKIVDVQGSILEFGVYMGSGAFSFLSFSSILEPYNYQRKIIGFDTFEGFPGYTDADLTTAEADPSITTEGFKVAGGLYNDLQECAAIQDQNRPIGHIQKLELVKGDITHSLPKFLEENPHTLISLLYLDMDLYEPTKLALELLYDRVVPGGIVAFDEINNPAWPGETKAYLEFFNGQHGRLQKCSFEPLRSYFVKGE